MEWNTAAIAFLSIIFTTIFLLKLFCKSKQLPPGPKPWPIIGNIHELGDKPHRAVTELSKKYGPIMTLKLGSNTTIVISSPEIAKKMFLEHDLALSSRSVPDATRAENHRNLSIAWLPVSPKWRNLRKIATTQLFTHQRLDASRIIRKKKELFVAGTDTTASTIEWAMTELLRNPINIEKAQIKMDEVLGKCESFQETDVKKLPYIQVIVKETMRLHPAAPFLLPRKATKDVQLYGFLVPENSRIWVNVWSIGRDPRVWHNPNIFWPERFLESEIDVKGRDFELIPFGSGRRMCPGMPLADRMMHLILATLLHSFTWEIPKAIDMEEKFGLSLQKANPLQAIPHPR